MKNTNLVWVTNLPAPYRIPIFDELAKIFDLKVIFTLGENNWRGWKLSEEKKWRYKFLEMKYHLFGDFEFVPGLVNPFREIQKPSLMILGSWETPFYFLLILYSKLRKIPVIGIYESHEKSQRYKKGPISLLRTLFYRNCTQVISFGRYSDYSLKKMGVSETKLISLYNPVNGEFYSNFAKEHRRETQEGHRFLFVGQLIARKNILNLILAFNSFSNKFDTLEIVGEGEQYQELVNEVLLLKCEKRIRFTGYINPNDMAKIYSRNDTLILVSFTEVWGLVVNEALASGMHVIVSERCGVVSLVQGMKGVYVCDTNFKSIGEAIIQSRNNFTKAIESPEILNYSTHQFAKTLSDKITYYAETD